MECAICLEPLLKAVRAVPCGHSFHGACLGGCLANGQECPLCRQHIQRVEKDDAVRRQCEQVYEGVACDLPQPQREGIDLSDANLPKSFPLKGNAKLAAELARTVEQGDVDGAFHLLDQGCAILHHSFPACHTMKGTGGREQSGSDARQGGSKLRTGFGGSDRSSTATGDSEARHDNG